MMATRIHWALPLAFAVACGSAPPPKPAEAGATTSASATATPPATTTAAPPPATTSTSTPTSTSTSTEAPATATAAGGTDAATKTKPVKIAARHILIQYMGAQQASSSVVRTRDQALVVAQDVLKRAKAGEDFARLAVEFSDEPGAASRGGSLGRFGHGAMVREFETAAFALAPGEVSGIVETPFGYHIIQRTE
jgi:hypothetical protein